MREGSGCCPLGLFGEVEIAGKSPKHPTTSSAPFRAEFVGTFVVNLDGLGTGRARNA